MATVIQQEGGLLSTGAVIACVRRHRNQDGAHALAQAALQVLYYVCASVNYWSWVRMYKH